MQEISTSNHRANSHINSKLSESAAKRGKKFFCINVSSRGISSHVYHSFVICYKFALSHYRIVCIDDNCKEDRIVSKSYFYFATIARLAEVELSGVE